MQCSVKATMTWDDLIDAVTRATETGCRLQCDPFVVWDAVRLVSLANSIADKLELPFKWTKVERL